MAVEFAYAQARAQARHGDRLTPVEWRMLESSDTQAQFLRLAGGTSLAPWLQHFSRKTNPHAIEASLRRDWREEVDRVARWAPAHWRAAVSWTRWLSDLPALAQLLRGEELAEWISREPTLASLALADADERRRAVRASEPVKAFDRRNDDDLLDSWLAHWRELWPHGDAGNPALQQLAVMVAADRVSPPATGPDRYGDLESRTLRLMRRNTNHIVVIFCHLLLTALQLYRLRHGLIARALQSGFDGEAAT